MIGWNVDPIIRLSNALTTCINCSGVLILRDRQNALNSIANSR